MTINYLDWWNIFVNEVAGSPILFVIIAIVIISIVSARNRFANTVYFMILTLFMLIISIEVRAILPFAIFIIMSFVGVQLARYVSRG